VDCVLLFVNNVTVLSAVYVVTAFKVNINLKRGHAVAQLGHCATRRKVAGSISDGVIGIFYLHNRTDHTMALRSNRNGRQEYFRWGGRVKDAAHRADNLTTFMSRLS